jgi:guanine deaminase
MDRSSPPNYIETTSDSLASTKSFIAHFDSFSSGNGTPLVQPIITPRFAISCTPDLLRGLGELAHSRTPSIAIQTHMSENLKEIATVKDMFKDECGGCETYAGVYERYGLLGDGTILAHCVHLDEAERAVLRRTGSGVSHCPSSNLFLNSGAARIRDLLHDDIKVSSAVLARTCSS